MGKKFLTLQPLLIFSTAVIHMHQMHLDTAYKFGLHLIYSQIFIIVGASE